jgi:hypothetical protein
MNTTVVEETPKTCPCGHCADPASCEFDTEDQYWEYLEERWCNSVEEYYEAHGLNTPNSEEN